MKLVNTLSELCLIIDNTLIGIFSVLPCVFYCYNLYWIIRSTVMEGRWWAFLLSMKYCTATVMSQWYEVFIQFFHIMDMDLRGRPPNKMNSWQFQGKSFSLCTWNKSLLMVGCSYRVGKAFWLLSKYRTVGLYSLSYNLISCDIIQIWVSLQSHTVLILVITNYMFVQDKINTVWLCHMFMSHQSQLYHYESIFILHSSVPGAISQCPCSCQPVWHYLYLTMMIKRTVRGNHDR